jgi:glutathione S-transferase
MTLTLYELAGRDGHRFSPFCWRTLMALKHKELAFERVAMTFTDRACVLTSGQDRVPVLGVDGRMISDSWAIACHLEDGYPDRPSLFGCAIGRAQTLFFNRWVDAAVHRELRTIVVPDVWEHVVDEDRAWFREDRERLFGITFEEMRARRPAALVRLRRVLDPVRAVLDGQAYLCGAAPAYADYVLFGTFMWPRCASPAQLLEADDPLASWRQRMLDLFDGFAAAAPGYALE